MSLPLPQSYAGLREHVRRTGRIDEAALREVAIVRATDEWLECDRKRIPASFYDLKNRYLAELREMAQAWLDEVKSERARAALSPEERHARHYELRAEIAEGSIPPRPAEARRFREAAAMCCASICHGRLQAAGLMPTAHRISGGSLEQPYQARL